MTAPTTSELIERLRERASEDHERGCEGRNYTCSCGYDDAGDGLITLAASRLADLEREGEEAEHRVCEGCGSSRSHAYLKAGGWRSCCPERKMLTAKEWHDRAEAAERSLQEAKGVIERAYWLIERDDTISAERAEEVLGAFRAFLNRSAADGEGYGSPRPTLNADEGPGTNPQPDKSREGT